LHAFKSSFTHRIPSNSNVVVGSRHVTSFVKRGCLSGCVEVEATPYAVIELEPGVRHFVEEGSNFVCSRRMLSEVSLGGTVTFQKVIALKDSEGSLRRGKPYLPGVLVEGRFEDEFRGPGSWASLSSQDNDTYSEQMLRKILITRIQEAEAAFLEPSLHV